MFESGHNALAVVTHRPSWIDRDELSLASGKVTKVDVSAEKEVANREVDAFDQRRRATCRHATPKSNEPAVGCNDWIEPAPGDRRVGSQIDHGRITCLPIMNIGGTDLKSREGHSRGVVGRRSACESDIAPVRRGREGAATTKNLSREARVASRSERGRAAVQIMDDDVLPGVPVTGDEVVGQRLECERLEVGAHEYTVATSRSHRC